MLFHCTFPFLVIISGLQSFCSYTRCHSTKLFYCLKLFWMWTMLLSSQAFGMSIVERVVTGKLSLWMNSACLCSSSVLFYFILSLCFPLFFSPNFTIECLKCVRPVPGKGSCNALQCLMFNWFLDLFLLRQNDCQPEFGVAMRTQESRCATAHVGK